MVPAPRHRRPRPGRWIGLGLGLGGLAACIQVDAFQCLDDGDCVYQGRPGQCRLAERTCIYPDEACDTRWSTAEGECMPAVGVGEGSGSAEGSGSIGATSSDPGGSSESGEPDQSSGGVPLDCSSGTDIDLTPEGVVWASSVFSDNYHAFLGADGDYGTSWFSSGPEDGGPSIYRWTVLEPRCISRIGVTGNGLHDNLGFREDFGFESVTVRVYDEYDQIVFQQMLGMGGTPDPPVLVEPRVAGVRIELELFEHESSDCGGFSELEVTGF